MSTNGIAVTSPGSAASSNSIYAKVTWRLMPLLFIGYVVAYLDRVNVGFAKLQMLNDLHFSEAMYGFGAGIFFVGYFFFEVPSNLLLHRVGARRWIARIMVTWAVISAATAWVTSPTMFYVLRFVLGIAEAGFFPGLVLYLINRHQLTAEAVDELLNHRSGLLGLSAISADLRDLEKSNDPSTTGALALR